MNKFDLSDYFVQYGYDPSKKFAAFYGNKGQDIFGNFWIMPKRVVYGGVHANNIEALYHASKFLNGEIRNKFNNLSPLQAYYMSRKYAKYVRKDWNSIRDSTMNELLRIKFKIPVCTLVLLLTESKYLVEHNPVKGRDNYWSDDHDGSGQNKLGEMLMNIRKEYFGEGIVEKPNDYVQWISNNL